MPGSVVCYVYVNGKFNLEKWH